jgi:hypothetical protein
MAAKPMSLFAWFAQAKAGAQPVSPEFINGSSNAPQGSSALQMMHQHSGREDYLPSLRAALRSSSIIRTHDRGILPPST